MITVVKYVVLAMFALAIYGMGATTTYYVHERHFPGGTISNGNPCEDLSVMAAVFWPVALPVILGMDLVETTLVGKVTRPMGCTP